MLYLYICACQEKQIIKKFDVSDWNDFNRLLSGESRTNDALETWNGSFNKFLSHQSVSKLITRFDTAAMLRFANTSENTSKSSSIS